MNARSAARNRAYEIWREHGGDIALKEIALMLSVPPSKIRKWKTLDKWSMESDAPLANENSPGEIILHKIGAPIGNKNSVGHKSSSPKGNTNAVTTGENQTIWLDAMTDEERALYFSVDTDPLKAIEDTIRLLCFRERRMLLLLNSLHERQNLCEVKDIYEYQVKPIIAEVMDEDTNETSEIEITQEQKVLVGRVEKYQLLIDKTLAVEEALTRVQERKIRALEAKERIIRNRQLLAIKAKRGLSGAEGTSGE